FFESKDTVEDSPAKITNKEASLASLDESELNLTKKSLKYHKPSIDLLNKPVDKGQNATNGNLQLKAQKLEQTLQNFKVDARVVQVTQGPAITRYEIQPNIGVKVNSIVRLADDIALNLEAKSIRIEAPIPGKAAVGIEVENDSINMVTLREIIGSKEFKNAKSKITFAVGKDIAGKAIVADLKSMPHLLIAGSTGSGKSVCINSIITSILYKANPDEVKLVLIDPKVVELGNYNGIPHLLIPVVTEPSKAAAALNWAVAEMTDRYKKFADQGVRDLESYNEYVIANDEADLVMPQVVIIIDELADLMMAAPSQVEESICRLAQMARAAGMHLIVATQRPSVDIITGVIKANIPSRIAFAVSSQFDSRTILDMAGAEKLVGKGDMLFNPLGMGKPIRVQGTFISDGEVHKVIEHVKSQIEEVEYASDVLNTMEKTASPTKGEDTDDLLPEAIECVVNSGQASISMLQRRFRIGYNRGARIVDMMEARGIIGPQDGSRPRQVLISEDELEQLKKETEDI
ncbi:MAG: DNA translocase FtsK, partial [Eubacteriales bacterium]|nr:DNA translocase FtsK [Eubacteriales bacterium]